MIALGLAAVVVILVLWRIDIYFHPIAPCRRCKGSGMNWGSRKGGARGVCTHGPERPRFAARKSFDRHQRRRGR